MTWHDERAPAVYAAGERQAELEARGEAPWQKLRDARLARPFTRAELNTDVRVKETGEIGRVMDIAADSGRVLVSGLSVRWWFKPEELERGRVVEAFEAEKSRPAGQTAEMAEAFALLEAMTSEQRQFVMRCFCLGCFDRLKTGDVCHCENDE